MRILRTLLRHRNDERGGTAIEYGVLACVLAVVVVAFAASGMSLKGAVLRISVLLSGTAHETSEQIRARD
jgi:Flp pilus assembly pilin Flp